MPTMLDDLIKFLKVETGLTQDFLADTMLETPDTACALYEYAGVSSIGQIGSTHRSVQVVARSKQAKEGKATAFKMYKALESEDDILQITSTRWAMVNLRQTPFKMKVDDKGRHYYVFNFGITTG